MKDLSLKQLTFKLVVLLAPLSGQRIQSMYLLDTRNIFKSKSGYPVKVSRPEKHVGEIMFHFGE